MEEQLKRALRTPEVLLIGINGVVGGGIFLLPGQVTKLAGRHALWAYLVAGLICILIGLAFAEASSMFSRTGGAYVYTEQAFGKTAGFTVGWMSWLTYVAGWAALSNGFVSYLSSLLPGLSAYRSLTMVVVIALLAVLNTLGVKRGSLAINIFSIAKLIPLLLLIIIGLFHSSTAVSTLLPATNHFWQAVLILIFAYGGFEMASIPTGEMVNPRKTVTIAVLGTLTGVTVFYMLIQYAAVHLDPNLASTKAPLASAGGMMFTGGLVVMTIGAALSILGTKSGVALSSPRSLYALALGKSLPTVFAKVHPRFKTPVAAIWTTSILVMILAVSGTFEKLVLVNVAARLYEYLMVCLAVVVLRFKAKSHPRPFKIPFGIFIPTVAALLSLWLLAQETAKELLMAVLALAVGMVIYFFSRRKPVEGSDSTGMAES